MFDPLLDFSALHLPDRAVTVKPTSSSAFKPFRELLLPSKPRQHRASDRIALTWDTLFIFIPAPSEPPFAAGELEIEHGHGLSCFSSNQGPPHKNLS
uniref:Uncharacterized protein n=1 Tax=Oryza meridionalis TaxID=40149 RepID=A0A0E0DBT6_9ORYZ